LKDCVQFNYSNVFINWSTGSCLVIPIKTYSFSGGRAGGFASCVEG